MKYLHRKIIFFSLLILLTGCGATEQLGEKKISAIKGVEDFQEAYFLKNGRYSKADFKEMGDDGAKVSEMELPNGEFGYQIFYNEGGFYKSKTYVSGKEVGSTSMPRPRTATSTW